MNDFLKECLAYANITKLPKKWDGETPFLYAIALCKKVCGDDEYVIVRSDSEERVCGMKCFGTGAIEEYISIYPYSDNQGNATVLKVKYNEITTNNEVTEYGVVGVYTNEQAKQWIRNNGDARTANTDNPEKLKNTIKLILKNK